MRVACLYVEDLALVALLRADVVEELGGRAVAVTDGEGGRALVLGASAAARDAGVRGGQTVAQAGARCPQLLTRVMSAQAMRATLEALGEVGESVSPRVELVAPEDVRAPGAVGMAFVDVGGFRSCMPVSGSWGRSCGRARPRWGWSRGWPSRGRSRRRRSCVARMWA